MFQSPQMELVFQYLSNFRKDILDQVISQPLKEAEFYKCQGQINVIDDIMGLPNLLLTAKLRNEGEE